MSLAVQIHPVMRSRPCLFCLALQDGSVFADFDTDDDDRVFLRGISFDSFGYCGVGQSVTKMNAADSRFLLDAVAYGKLEREVVEVEAALRRYLRANTHVISKDALSRYDLL
jgi:hypothetical protein